MAIDVLHVSDPGCPWAYSANPWISTIRWRFGDQLNWRLATIGLSEDLSIYANRPEFTPARSAANRGSFRRRFGMPFIAEPRERHVVTALACRAIVATRLRHPGREHAVFRALQFGWMTTTLLTDTPEGIRAAIGDVAGIDADAIVAALDDDDVVAGFEEDKELARTAGGSPTEAMGRAKEIEGGARYTAPSLIFEHDGRRIDAGGFQPLEVYDTAIANLDTTLERRPETTDVGEILAAFPDGLTTQEVATIMTARLDAVDRPAAEAALIEAVGDGRARRRPMADDSLWLPA